MATVKTWSTKEEVLKDLARASGRRMRKREDLDEGYLVIGDAPPPLIVEDEDDEMQLLFSGAASRKTAPVEDATPDLRGIQQMLRMVQNFEEGDDDNDDNDATNPRDCVIAISKVSKLNPNVQEFIPKGVTSSCPNIRSNKDLTSHSKSATINNDDFNINTNVVTQSDDVLVEDSSNVLKDNDVNTANVNDKEPKSEYQDIASKLKDQISEAAISDSFDLKKQKNVAIATLLKLYAADKELPKKTSELKLITPEYYQSKKDDELKVVTKVPLTPSSSSSTLDPKNTSSIPTGSSTSISSTALTQPTSSENRLTPANKIDQEMKRSIQKVKNWFDEPSKCKSPAVCLGPIAFKRKDSLSCKSPVTSSNHKILKSSGDEQRYQPSNYAADLGRKYMERNKIKEQRNSQVTWTNLEDILKQKDLAIKKRLQEQTSSSASDESIAPQL